MRPLDANIFLRALVQPTTPQGHARHQASAALFRRAARGSELVTTCEAVLAEVLYVLTSPRQYGLSHQDASARVRPLLRLRGLHLPHKRSYLRALDLFDAHPHLDFEDAVQVAHLERSGQQELYSYDTDFDAVSGVRRLEP